MATSSTAPRRNGSPVKPKGSPPAIALLVYPLTLFMGSLYSIISPTARPPRTSSDHQTTPLAPTIASDINLPPTPSPTPVNYFARKDNIFNVYFVKVGWAWTTLAFLSLLLTQPVYTNAHPNLRARRIAQALLRYAIVTVSWFLITQWFFGPAIIDRTFTLTGGKCEDLNPAGGAGASAGALQELKVVVTAAACKAAGGAWRGGHDVSGHVFMLVLATAFLGFEALGASSSSTGSSAVADVKEKQESPTERAEVVVDSPVRVWALRFVWAVTLLSWWMLFMTAIWFHTWMEKVSGLLIALATVYITYFLPQTLPPWRAIIGVPGA
ncbi:hypothetical protein VTN77DRAFT_103 [Rasamsonia byssochlamydoides]|uniref:uncharacterized protein n=1 Tax=Rasamsonia byssochlamydoides TaxID=89139 RepID=UPI0037431726